MSGKQGTKVLVEAAVEHERLQSLIGSMADGVIAVDDDIKVVLYNGAALNILDTNGSIKNRTLKRLLQLYDKNGQLVDVEKLVRAAERATSNRDLLLHYDDGSRINIYLSIAPVRLGYGESGDRGFVLVSTGAVYGYVVDPRMHLGPDGHEFASRGIEPGVFCPAVYRTA